MNARYALFFLQRRGVTAFLCTMDAFGRPTLPEIPEDVRRSRTLDILTANVSDDEYAARVARTMLARLTGLDVGNRDLGVRVVGAPHSHLDHAPSGPREVYVARFEVSSDVEALHLPNPHITTRSVVDWGRFLNGSWRMGVLGRFEPWRTFQFANVTRNNLRRGAVLIRRNDSQSCRLYVVRMAAEVVSLWRSASYTPFCTANPEQHLLVFSRRDVEDSMRVVTNVFPHQLPRPPHA